MSFKDQERVARAKDKAEERTVTLPDGTSVPSIGQGTWYMGEDPREKDQEVKALQLGVEAGMKLIDTAEMYADGGAEEVTGEAIKGKREDVFLVSKAYPHHGGKDTLPKACEQSLRRLKTDYIDLYLLHWRGSIPLEETIEGMEQLKREGKIRRWGVSNFDTKDMEELLGKEQGSNCAVNQVLYHLGSRGIDYDLLPWQRQHNMPIMAYSPLARGDDHSRVSLVNHPTVKEIAEEHQVKPLQIALAWTIRNHDTIAIPKAVQENHVIENAEAASIILSEQELAQLDEAFPEPDKKVPLDII
ncbi:aldo/keto reductase [Bacillus sp. FJAT-44742]|uniref:aldo/keto reductase n=1 Tax=Bacillus sp. FJAT-44742 TaxID=2014005 RepID=UPI000C24403A|nr:aldo/keto reductase [Bacillus sp. FJAT-44742]